MTNSVDIRLGVAFRLDWGWGDAPTPTFFREV
jgi:hypothetical protein